MNVQENAKQPEEVVQKRSETEGDGENFWKNILKMHEMQETRGNGTKSHRGKR